MEKLKLDSALKSESKPILELDSDSKPNLESKLEEEEEKEEEKEEKEEEKEEKKEEEDAHQLDCNLAI